MQFLTPLFFTALAALAIPVLIHLIQREKKQVVFFPSLMFLDKIPYKSVQRRRIHNWALLLLRIAAMVLIILAFARPFLTDATIASVAATGAREVVILVDRSYSMAYGDRWDRAQAAAQAAVDDLVAGDRASLIFFGQGADVDARSTDDRARLRVSIDAAAVGDETTRYAPALKMAQSILEQSTRPQRDAVLISDFQQAGWEGAEDVRFPPGATLEAVAISDPATANVAVTSMALQREVVSGQERVTATAGLVNRSPDTVRGLDVTLEINGRAVQAEAVDVEADASGAVTFPPFTLPEGTARGIVRIAADDLPTDDEFYFTIAPARPVQVLVVERAGGGRSPSFYLTGALGIGREPSFQVDVRSIDGLGGADLAPYAVVILNDVPISGGVTGRLERFVEEGGGLFVVLGDRSTWPDSLAVMPGTASQVIDRGLERTGTMGNVDFSHAVFELFRAPRSGGFEGTRVFRYRALDVRDPAQVLARFDDGGVALAENAFGEGRVLVWTTTIDNVWNDLVLKPVFLPFVHRAMTYLARYEEPRAWQSVGQVYAQATDAENLLALSPSGERIELQAAVGLLGGAADGASDAVATDVAAPQGGQTLLPLQERGFYEIRDAVRETGPATAIAVNVDTTESDLTPLDPEELVASVLGRVGGSTSAGLAVESDLRPEDVERRQAIWWYLLLAGILLLAAETFLSNRLSRATE